ncbi:Trab Domain-Containing Protein, partial [Manis pentadactyla]
KISSGDTGPQDAVRGGLPTGMSWRKSRRSRRLREEYPDTVGADLCKLQATDVKTDDSNRYETRQKSNE